MPKDVKEGSIFARLSELTKNDVVTHIDSDPVADGKELAERFGFVKAGQYITFIRNGPEYKTKIRGTEAAAAGWAVKLDLPLQLLREKPFPSPVRM
jgi:hypothetical protein